MFQHDLSGLVRGAIPGGEFTAQLPLAAGALGQVPAIGIGQPVLSATPYGPMWINRVTPQVLTPTPVASIPAAHGVVPQTVPQTAFAPIPAAHGIMPLLTAGASVPVHANPWSSTAYGTIPFGTPQLFGTSPLGYPANLCR